MAKPKKEEIPEPQTSANSSQQVLLSFLKTNKEDHYNFEDDFYYKVSTGSLKLDALMDGGLNPGLHRFCGINEGGKTSEALEVMKNFLLTVPDAKGFYIKAEGRLSPNMIKRSGVPFVFTAEEWVVGTCFVFESNIYETCVDAMRTLVVKNPEKNKYCFVLDSVDGLLSKNDEDKTFEDSNKVAGGAVIAANFMKRMSIALAKRGHMAIFVSQVRADIKLDPYSKAPIRQTSATGGNALLHFANWILEFEPRYSGDIILKNPSVKKMDAVKNPPVGHWAKVTVKKSPNEKTTLQEKYPILYGRKGGTSIWVEWEITDMLLKWELLEVSGSWISMGKDLIELLEENGLGGKLPEKIQGENAICKVLEENEDVKIFLFKYFKSMVSLDDSSEE